MPLDLKGIGKNKGLVIAGAGSLVAVATYILIKHEKAKAAASAAAASSTASPGAAAGYGYAYGYGSSYGYAGVTPYPYENADEYGYGAYGYGLYNPSTGQYYGAVGTGTPATVAQTTNAEWTQAALSALEAQGVESTTALAAIGLYLAGQTLTAAQAQLITQATALEGYPPQSGADGYPPGIHQQAATGQTGTTSATSAGAISNLVVTKASNTSIKAKWNPTTNAKSGYHYVVTDTKGGGTSHSGTITATSVTVGGLTHGHTYNFAVQGLPGGAGNNEHVTV